MVARVTGRGQMARTAKKSAARKGSKPATGAAGKAAPEARGYVHATTDMAARPEIGVAPRLRSKAPPVRYRYDSSLSPALDWDTAPARDAGAFLLSCVDEAAALPSPQLFPAPRVLKGGDGEPLLTIAGLQDALAALKRMQRPFLDWAGKAERAAFDVPTMPLFVHERLSTAAIVETFKAHEKKAPQSTLFDLFADPRRPLAEQVRSYEHQGRDPWANRLILGDSLVVMNSLLHLDGLGGQVQMIYMDPPYGVKFGSNFQPFVRKRDVSPNDDADMTREPEMVQAYRDTWELGLHSYLTYLRDRLLLARDLLAPTGSIFVQISDANLHHVREVMDEVFGSENFCVIINFVVANAQTGDLLENNCHYLVHYAKEKARAKFRPPFLPKSELRGGQAAYRFVELPDGTRRTLTKEERKKPESLPQGARIFRADKLMSSHPPGSFPVEFEGRTFIPKKGYWSTGEEGMARLKSAKRLIAAGDTLSYVRFIDDFPAFPVGSQWNDTVTSGFTSEKLYAVQTNAKVVQRCMLMTTDPGDLVFDPTCGSGTTAYVAEQWGRRWMTCDTSRVPLALTRQRLLTASFPWYNLKDEKVGPGSGFVYARRQNRKGEEVGGIVPHITMKAIANDAPPAEEVLVDRPEQDAGVTRITGPFVVEATLPTPELAALTESEEKAAPPSQPVDEPGDHIARMIEVLRRAPTLALPGNRKITLRSIRRPGRTLSLSAEAFVDQEPGALSLAGAEAADSSTTALVAVLFGPADGPVTGKAVLDAAKEANVKGYRHLFVIGFAFTAEARTEIEGGEAALGLPATAVSASMDLQMGDLLRNQRSSQIFAVCGLPEIAVKPLPDAEKDGTPRWQVTLLGLDSFDPVTMTTDHQRGDNVPCWMLDTGWNGLVFHAGQVFFPRTGAWENLRKALKATHDENVWQHLAGDTSAPFAAPEGTEVAVKVLDDRGNELMVTRKLTRAAAKAPAKGL